MFAQYLEEIQIHAPEDFVLNHLAGSFAEAVRWWLKNAMRPAPEVFSAYFMDTIKMLGQRASCAKKRLLPPIR